MTFSGHVQKVLLQGSMSQIFSSCPSLNFIKCRKSYLKKISFFVIELELGLKSKV